MHRVYALCVVALLVHSGEGIAAEWTKVVVGREGWLGVERTIDAEIAATPEAWIQGLKARRALPHGRGMLFVFPNDVRHTFTMEDTLIPLDLLFVDGHGRVVDVIVGAKPQSGALRRPRRPYRFVLEIPAGSVPGIALPGVYVRAPYFRENLSRPPK